MPPLLNLNCILEILYLDNNSLFSCLFLNSVYSKEVYGGTFGFVLSQIMIYQISHYLIVCLPDDSKDYLCQEYNENNKDEIFKTTHPRYKYASYCKVLNIHIIKHAINNFEKEFDNGYLLSELLKMFMNDVRSLKSLERFNLLEQISQS
ncbi:6666_t:CDS:1 [Funneliformis caledonium]|uniref:6666_t:CDS:1 n=1 Tax=Funneliformis caledonium TaxID=1117310 RepID=A0A9N8WJH2_9GLOM|nr:6666_t:CDS:1 [Funneliformis caledonium]